MNTAYPIPRYTYKDYEIWEGDWELIEGYPYAMSPAPLYKHQLIAKNLLFEIEFQLRENRKNGCGCVVIHESDWIITEGTVVRPDIAVVCDKIDRNDFIRIPPVLIVEIFSPSTRLKDRDTKFRLYQECGVKYYLMADPDLKKIEVFELTDNIYKEMPAKNSFSLDADCTISLDYSTLFTDL